MVYNRITIYRVEANLSRKDLALAVGVNPQTIGFLERGGYSPSVELALKLASVFGVPVDSLFSLTPFPPLATQIARVNHQRSESSYDELTLPASPRPV